MRQELSSRADVKDEEKVRKAYREAGDRKRGSWK
jgi:hypothetical protein